MYHTQILGVVTNPSDILYPYESIPIGKKINFKTIFLTTVMMTLIKQLGMLFSDQTPDSDVCSKMDCKH